MQLFMQIVTFILGLPFQLQKLLQLEEIILACIQALNDYIHAHAWMLLSTKTIKASDFGQIQTWQRKRSHHGQTYEFKLLSRSYIPHATQTKCTHVSKRTWKD